MDTVVSPDGKNVYTVGNIGGPGVGVLAVFNRNFMTGALTQPAGQAACLSSEDLSGACTVIGSFLQARSVAISPDGKNVYVGHGYAGGGLGLTIFDRSPSTGLLTRKGGTAGCIDVFGGPCAVASRLTNIKDLAVSPDGKNLYAAAAEGGSLVEFSRNTSNGELTQLSPHACVGSIAPCDLGTGLDLADGVAVAPDGRFVYSSAYAGGLAVFQRDAATGALTQLAGGDGCFNEGGSNGCGVGRGLAAIKAMTMSPDGKNLYTAGWTDNAIGSVNIDKATGHMSQAANTSSCLSLGGTSSGTNGMCTDDQALGSLGRLEVSPDGKSLAASVYGSGQISIYNRDTASGAITVKVGTHRCLTIYVNPVCDQGKGLGTAGSVAFGPEGRSIYSAGGESSLAFVLRYAPAAAYSIASKGLAVRRSYVDVKVGLALPSAGKASVAIVRSGKTLCSVSGSYLAKGKRYLVCRLGRSVRKLMKRGKVRVTLKTSYLAALGAKSSKSAVIVLPHRA